MVDDEQIGRNLAKLRGDMTQKDLAVAMRARDFKWSQATVWSIEKGERPLRFSEAIALSDLFHRPVERLLAMEDREAEIQDLASRLQRKAREIQDLFVDYDQLRFELALAFDRLSDDEISGWTNSHTTWIDGTPAEIVRQYYLEKSGNAGMTAEEWAELDTIQEGTWVGRLNENDQRDIAEWTANGKHQATT